LSPIILVVGTRAEAIKLIPLYFELKKEKLPALLCATDQHLEMLKDVFSVFDVTPDFSFNIMKQNQDLFHVTTSVLKETKSLYQKIKPSLVIVHGDTTTTMSAALSAFYLHIPIAHVEAGLRTGNMQSPFPEEMNRKIVGQIANYHFSPTAFSTANLLAEGVPRENVFCTGNPVVDALHWVKEKIINKKIQIDSTLQNLVTECKQKNKKMILLTAHRRESFNGGLLRIFNSVKQFAITHPDVFIFYPTHPNPNVQKAINESGITSLKNIFTTKQILYKDLIYLLMNVNWVATDSGGIQEEAVSLGKKVIALRDFTERMEGVWEGSEVLVGTNEQKILNTLEQFYNEQTTKLSPSTIYGDGKACTRIVSILKERLNNDVELIDNKHFIFCNKNSIGKRKEAT
jgi:UDP-N-acetylglucosamine 2-epimerase (non-hydrolysing)